MRAFESPLRRTSPPQPAHLPPALSLAIATNGEPITSTTAIITPAAANQYQNVTLMNYIDVPRGCCTQLSINNISSVTVSIANANLLVERVA